MTALFKLQNVLLAGLLCQSAAMPIGASEQPAEVIELEDAKPARTVAPVKAIPPVIVADPKPAPAAETPAPQPVPPDNTSPLDVNEPGFKATVLYRTAAAPKISSTENATDPSSRANREWGLSEEDGVTPVADNQELIEDLSGSEPLSALLEKAISHAKGKKSKEAIPIYQEVVLAEPDNAEAYYQLGATLVKAGELSQGATMLEKAVVLKPKNVRYLSVFGQAALQAGWQEKALVACQAAALAAPKEARYQSAFGDCLLATGRHPEATAAYTRAIAIDKGQNPAYIYNLGLVHLHIREFKKAIQIFDEAIAARHDYSPYFCSRGLAYENLKNIKQALNDYAMAIRIDKNDAYAHFLLAGIFSNPDDPTYTNNIEALTHAEKACKLTEYKNARYLMGLARALRVAYNYDQAVAVARKAIQIDPREEYRQELEKYQVKLKQEGAFQNDGKK